MSPPAPDSEHQTKGGAGDGGGKGGPLRALRVVGAQDVTPRTRRVLFTFEGIGTFDYLPGQAMVFGVPTGDGKTGRRDYTIRGIDREAGTMSVDFVLHGDAPGANWARAAAPGDTIEARGPRGRTIPRPAADWHLFCGDETCIPAILHILEALPPGVAAHAFIEVGSEADEQRCATRADLALTYLSRTAPAGGGDTLVLDRLAAFALPAGDGHAYVIGETAKVRQWRRHLLERGLSKEQISAEGYWRPGRTGGHDHIRD